MKIKNEIGKVIIAVGIGYILFVGVFIWYGMLFLQNYQMQSRSYLETIEQAISSNVLHNRENLTENLERLIEQYPMEIFISQDDTILYKSILNMTKETVINLLNEQAISLESYGYIDTDYGKIFLWYGIYQMPNQLYIDNYFSKQASLILIMIMILLAVSVYTQYILVKPIKKLRTSMQKAYDYQFADIELGNDGINQQFGRLTNKIQKTIHVVSREHTQLEQSLQIERERVSNLLVVTRSLVHDLKTPVHEAMLENESYELISKQLQIQPMQTLVNYNLKQTDQTLKMINEILQILDEDVYDYDANKENFDLVKLVLEMKNLFHATIEKKALDLDVSLPLEQMLLANKVTVKLLIHNILSNALKYAIEETEIAIDVFATSGYITIICENYSTIKNIERMKKSENLFNSYAQADDEHYYSSGNGLFLIKELVVLLKGEYFLEIIENRVQIKVIFAIGGDS